MTLTPRMEMACATLCVVLCMLTLVLVVMNIQREPSQPLPLLDLSADQCRALCAPAPVEGLSTSSCQCFHRYFERERSGETP